MDCWMCACGVLITRNSIVKVDDSGKVVACTECQPDAEPGIFVEVSFK